MNPRILVVGTGAIGGFYGGKLAQAGARVATLCRSDYEAVKSEGIKITSTYGNFHFVPEKVIGDLKEYGSPPDYLLVGLKVLPEINTAEMLKEVVGPDTVIVLLQNGVQIEEPVARAFPNNQIISGLAFICVTRTDPGHIDHVDFGRLVIGRFPAGRSDKTDLLAGLFNDSGVPCTISENVVTDRWRKLVWNAPFNPISVLAGGADTKTMVDNPESLELARQVMKEVCKVAKAVGHPLPAGVVEENIEGTRRMSPYKSSMLVDFEAGRPMEVEAILGNGIRAAKRYNLAVPHMESLYGLLKLVDKKIRSQRNS
jgi:2-dehydropantoate 2-reductase